jgi:hypothetical protein
VPQSKEQVRPARPAEEGSIGDVVDTLKAYVRQEVVGPLSGVGRWIAYGAAGAVMLGLGLVIVLVGLLRLLQTEWDRSATGALTWLSYLIVFIVAVLLLALTVSRIRKSTLNDGSSSSS